MSMDKTRMEKGLLLRIALLAHPKDSRVVSRFVLLFGSLCQIPIWNPQMQQEDSRWEGTTTMANDSKWKLNIMYMRKIQA
jgi:hypothetical protein